MSIEVMSVAFYVEGLTPAQKSVLVSLADHADDYGRKAYPSVARLAAKTSCAERTVRRALSDLRDMGLIKVQKESTQHIPTCYFLDLPEMHLRTNKEYFRPATDAPLENSDLPESPPDLPESPSRPARNAPDPSYNHQEPSLLDDFPELTPLPALIRHFTELTTYFPPSDTTPNFENKWKHPLMAIFEKAGSITAAMEAIGKSVELLIAKKYRISSPYSIQTTAVNILNGADEKKNTPDYRPLWSQVKTEMETCGRRSKRQWNGEIAPVLRRAGGYTNLCSLSAFDAEQTFKNAFKDMT